LKVHKKINKKDNNKKLNKNKNSKNKIEMIISYPMRYRSNLLEVQKIVKTGEYKSLKITFKVQ
jgi:hypothetical protein